LRLGQAQAPAGDFSDHPPGKTSAFLQNWLYFGTLWTVIGENATKESYMKQGQENGNDVVTTELLFQHLCTSLRHARRQLENLSSPGLAMVEKIESCLKQVSMLCRLAVSVDETKSFSTVWPREQIQDFRKVETDFRYRRDAEDRKYVHAFR
jgi:hypothetical protein